jgi:hypothetical protein
MDIDFNKIKELLKEDTSAIDGDIHIYPILHNEHSIILLLDGWSINLLENSTWFGEATDGG